MKKRLAALFAVLAISTLGLAIPPVANAGCFAQFQKDIEDCGGAAAVACNADAYVALVACIHHQVFG